MVFDGVEAQIGNAFEHGDVPAVRVSLKHEVNAVTCEEVSQIVSLL